AGRSEKNARPAQPVRAARAIPAGRRLAKIVIPNGPVVTAARPIGFGLCGDGFERLLGAGRFDGRGGPAARDGESRGGAQGDDGSAEEQGWVHAGDEGVSAGVAAAAGEDGGENGDSEYSAKLADGVVR